VHKGTESCCKATRAQRNVAAPDDWQISHFHITFPIMRRDRVEKQDGKTFGTYNVEIHPTYRNPNYTLSYRATNEISSHGRLNVFEINPSGKGPSFAARWDGGSRDAGKPERNDLDIDIYGVSDEEKRRFKNGDGYSGHRNVASTGHTYHVDLRTPDERIFEGTVSFNLLRKQGFEANLYLTATLDAKLIRAED